MLKSSRDSTLTTWMVDTLLPKIVNEAKAFVVAPEELTFEKARM